MVTMNPLTGNLIKKSQQGGPQQIEMNLPVPSKKMDDFPSHLQHRAGRGQGKWEWLRKYIVNEMGSEARTRGKSVQRLEFPNKHEVVCAQAAAQGVCPDRKHSHTYTCFPLHSQYGIETRTEPITGEDGAYFLYIKVTFPIR